MNSGEDHLPRHIEHKIHPYPRYILLGTGLGLIFGVICIVLTLAFCWLWKRRNNGKHVPYDQERASLFEKRQSSIFPIEGIGQYTGQRLSLMQPRQSLQSYTSQKPSDSEDASSTISQDCQSSSTTLPGLSGDNFSVGSNESQYGGVIPDLYHQERRSHCSFSSEGRAPGGPILGKLRYQLGFDFNTSDLVVELIEGKDLVATDENKGFLDPFVSLELEPSVDNRLRQSSLKRKTQNPEYQETFKFPITFEQLQYHTICFVLHDYDKFSRHNPLGEVHMSLNCDLSTPMEFWGDVHPCRLKHCLGGEILVSLSYLPTAERLTVVVMKARNLKIPSSSNLQSVDPYARVVLIMDGKRLKKRKSSVKRKNTNPVWNEALTFNLPVDWVSKVTLEISIFDRDLLGHDELIGSLSIGQNVTGSGKEHWIDVGANARKMMAMWHPLVK